MYFARKNELNIDMRVRENVVGTNVPTTSNFVKIVDGPVSFEIRTVDVGTCQLSPLSIRCPKIVSEMITKCPDFYGSGIPLSLSLSLSLSLFYLCSIQVKCDGRTDGHLEIRMDVTGGQTDNMLFQNLV